MRTNNSTAGADDHTTRERQPPSRPIPLEFPSYAPPFHPQRLDSNSSSSIRDKICHIRSFTEISDADLSRLNVKFDHDVDLSQLLPGDQFSDRPYLFDEDLDSMLTEISVDNQDAFREILRMEPLPGHAKPKLAYARNFFSSLEDMARYWDNSMDKYYHVPADKDISRKPSGAVVAKTIKGPSDLSKYTTSSTKTNGNTDTDMVDADSAITNLNNSQLTEVKEVYKGYRFGNGEQLNPGTRVAMVKNLLKMATHKFMCREHEPMPAPREKLVIRGVKVQSVQYHFCVARIPSDSKLGRARMVEGPLMAAHCREELRFKQNPSLASPEDLLAGATMVSTGQAPRKSATSRGPPAGPPFVGERFDFFREIGCMLILATQRAREGKSKDSYSGADKWWVAEKRFGNGPLRWGQLAIEAYEDEDPSWSPEERKLQEEKRQRQAEEKENGKNGKEPLNSANIRIDDLMANNAPPVSNVPGEPISGPRKKKLRSLERPPGKEEEVRDGRRLMYVPPFRQKWYTDWQKLKPNTPVWDDKIIYKHIGQRDTSEWDDIYMISSVNHHVALLRMRVHPDYLAWVESGKEVPQEGTDDGMRRDVAYVQRSTWYDMFDVQSRRHFLIALWRVMCWLNRNCIDQSEYDKMEERRKAMRSM